MHFTRSFTASVSVELPRQHAQRFAAYFRKSIANNNGRKGGLS